VKKNDDVATLTEESLDTLNRAMRFRWDRIITQHADGSRHTWLFEDVVAPRSRPGFEVLKEEDVSEARVEHSATACEWPVISDWNQGRCGRWGSTSHLFSGVALCWQHADAAFSDTLGRLETGDLGPRQIEQLVGALLRTDKFKPNGSPEWHPDIATFVEQQIESYIYGLINEDKAWARQTWLHRGPRRHIDELINELIEKRIQQKWGADS